MGYNIAKKSVTSWNTDGTPVYDRYTYCDSFREVLSVLSCKNTYHVYGKGSDILDKNDEIIFHTDDYKELESDNANNYELNKYIYHLKA